MTITVELPDDIVTHEGAAREALEAIAIQGYRDGSLTHRQAAHLLSLYWYDFEGLLKQRGATEGAYDEELFRNDIKALSPHQAKNLPSE